MPLLSVLDLSPVPAGRPESAALHASIDLARHVERLGFHRHWLAEHHSIPSVVSTAPEVLIGHVAAATSTIRVGSGGMMLPNHAPLRVAEQFKVLEALHPGRIDLGIGRAPGSDQVAALAIRRSREALMADDFTQQLAELLCVSGMRPWPETHPFRALRAMPTDVALPPVFLLGSSDFSAQVAAVNGMGFAFAGHINPGGAQGAMQLYRERFVPSPERAEPHAILAAAVVVGEDEEDAERLAVPGRLSMVRLRQGRPEPIRSVEEALATRLTPQEEAIAAQARRAAVVGSPIAVREKLDELMGRTEADELMVTTHVADHEDRLASYERLAGAFALQGVPA
jgi:luciferase family oxidoreductase group 1